MSIAHFIDHTVLKPTTSLGEIQKACNEAKQYGFAAVCIPPYYVKDASQMLAGSACKLATVIGFPFGYSDYKAKMQEAIQAIADSAHELDVVMNIAAFRSNDIAYLESEIGALTGLAKKENVLIKLIIETGILTDEEIKRCCQLYRHFPVDFLKTSTGYAEKGATVHAVQLLRKNLPDHIQVKASGGIKSYEFAKSLLDAGATRLGCSASVAIVTGEPVINSGY